VARLDLIKELILLGFIILTKNKYLELIIFNIPILLLLFLFSYPISLLDLRTNTEALGANSIFLLALLLKL
jgi:hypothetical protein